MSRSNLPIQPPLPSTLVSSPPSQHKARAETPIAFIQAIVKAYERRGLNPEAALVKAQIEPKLLHKPRARVTALQMETLSATAMQELDDEALGWFSRRLPWGSYGLLVRASLTAPTLGLALARWCRHHALLTDDVVLRVSEQDGLVCLQLDERVELGELREFCIVSTLRNALGVACWLSDSRIALRRATLRFAAPAHRASYPLLFDGEVRFDAQHNGLWFDAGYLALPVRRDEAALQRMLQRALLLTVKPYRRDRLLVEQVRQALTQHPQHCRNAKALAAHLNLSERSLHRQLKEEGASLQALKDAVRHELATELLLRTAKPLKQVAEAVGFRNEKSFSRAFKAWSKHTPEELRQSSDQALGGI